MLARDLLYFLLLLVGWPFWLKHLLNPAYRPLLKDRLRPRAELAGMAPIWIHAVSVGEVRSLKTLVAALQAAGRPVALSVTTPAGFAFARETFPGLPVFLAPLDFSFVVRRFVARLQPRLMVFNELELWPNWIALLRRRRVPILLINGRITPAALRRYRLFAFILRPFFRGLDRCLVQNDLYRGRFLQLGVEAGRIAVCGNIKADEAEAGLADIPPAGEVRRRLGLAEARPLAVLASSHAEDEEVFIPAIPARAGDFQFVIVPRHVGRAAAICARLEREGVAHALFSRLQPGAAPPTALVYDRMGFLFPILSAADVVFMGGTFAAKTGGHNLYEPAALGKVIAGGPHTENFPDIGRELRERGAYRQLGGSREWGAFLQEFSGLDRGRIAAAARAAVAARKGSVACTLKHIESLLA